jgi:hypothetical protein
MARTKPSRFAFVDLGVPMPLTDGAYGSDGLPRNGHQPVSPIRGLAATAAAVASA